MEFLDEEAIFSRYGAKGIRENELDPKSKKALISDDTQMTLFTADGILAAQTRGCMRGIGGDPLNHILLSYMDWLRTQEIVFEDGRKQMCVMPFRIFSQSTTRETAIRLER